VKKEYLSEIEKNDLTIASEPAVAYGMPASVNPAILVGLIGQFSSAPNHIQYLKKNTGATDDTIAYWLNVNVKTYRSYRGADVSLKPDIKEHLIILAAIVRHGTQVFGSGHAFGQWLHADNFMLGGQKPSDLLNTNSGVRMVDDRLTGMEFGDNA